MQTVENPWYREPWTWLLIGLPAIAVVASLTSAFLAIEGADPIIEDNYYQRGLDINATLARVHNAAALGIHASVEYDGLRPGESVWVRVRSAQALHDTAVQIRLIHPARSGADRQAVLARVPGSSDTEAEYTGQWPDKIPRQPPSRDRPHGQLAHRLAGQDWQVEGDVHGRNDIAAR
jgi:hypothetical protein